MFLKIDVKKELSSMRVVRKSVGRYLNEQINMWSVLFNEFLT